MKCTQCGKEQTSLHGIYWSSVYGFVIEEGELLCDECAELREGFEQPGDLLKSQEQKLTKEELCI